MTIDIQKLKGLNLFSSRDFDSAEVNNPEFLNTLIELRDYPHIVERFRIYLNDLDSQDLDAIPGALLVTKLSKYPELKDVCYTYLTYCPRDAMYLPEEMQDEFFAEYIAEQKISVHYYNHYFTDALKKKYISVLQKYHSPAIECFYHVDRIVNYKYDELIALCDKNESESYRYEFNLDTSRDVRNIAEFLKTGTLIYDFFMEEEHANVPLSFFTIFQKSKISCEQEHDLSQFGCYYWLATRKVEDDIEVLYNLEDGYNISMHYILEFFQRNYQADFVRDVCARMNQEQSNLTMDVLLLTFFNVPVSSLDIHEELTNMEDVLGQLTDINISCPMAEYLKPYMKKHQVTEMELCL